MEHRQHLLSVNSKLEAEKQNVAKSFEKKLEKRRLQKVRAVMDLAVPVSIILKKKTHKQCSYNIMCTLHCVLVGIPPTIPTIIMLNLMMFDCLCDIYVHTRVSH